MRKVAVTKRNQVVSRSQETGGRFSLMRALFALALFVLTVPTASALPVVGCDPNGGAWGLAVCASDVAWDTAVYGEQVAWSLILFLTQAGWCAALQVLYGTC